MGSSRLYAWVFSLTAIFSAIALIVWDGYKTSTLAQALIELKRTRPEICYFGDSIVVTSEGESDPRTILDIFEAKCSKSVGSIAHAAYSPMVYRDAMELMVACGIRPKVFILPLSTQYFTPKMTENPHNLFILDRKRAFLQFEGSLGQWWDFLYWRFVNSEKEMLQRHLNSEVILFGRKYQRRSFVHTSLAIPLHYSSIELVRHRMAPFFAYHYGETIDPQSVALDTLKDIQRLAKQLRAKLWIYFTPINHQDARYIWRDDFDNVQKNNMLFIQQLLKELKIPFVDYTELVTPDQFMDRRYVCDHLFAGGRKMLVEKICRDMKLEDDVDDRAAELEAPFSNILEK